MKKEKCIIFDFSKGKRADTAYFHYHNGQLDLDLNIEVKSPEPLYGCKVINFKKSEDNRENSSCANEQLPIYTA